MTIITIGDEVEIRDVVGCGQRKVIEIDGGDAVVEGFQERVALSRLIFRTLTAEHVARFLLSRPEDDIPAAIAAMQRDEKVMKPRLIAFLHEIVSSERFMSAVILQVPARSYCWNDTSKVAEQVLDHLVKTVASA